MTDGINVPPYLKDPHPTSQIPVVSVRLGFVGNGELLGTAQLKDDGSLIIKIDANNKGLMNTHKILEAIQGEIFEVVFAARAGIPLINNELPTDIREEIYATDEPTG